MNSQPKEIIKYILEYIPEHILIILTRVSKEWLDLIENHILHLKVIPSFEQCIMAKNYFYGRRYLYHQLDNYQEYLITLMNDKMFIRHFIISKINVNINDAFINYSKKGHIEVVKLLLEKGADLHADNDYALRWSAQQGHLEVVKLLLEKGADLHVYNNWIFKHSNGDVCEYLTKINTLSN